MSELKSPSSVNSPTDSSKSRKLATFTFKPHTYYITEQAVDDVHVSIKRKLRYAALPNMIMKSPANTMMGQETIIGVRYLGQPARHFPWSLCIQEKEIQKGITDFGGFSYGLDIRLYRSCSCQPFWFAAHYSTKDLNDRCCDGQMPYYELNIYLPLQKDTKEDTESDSDGVIVDEIGTKAKEPIS